MAPQRPELAPSTERNYRKAERRYERWAREAGQDPLHPDPTWVVVQLYREAQIYSVHSARKIFRALHYYFRRNKVVSPFEDPAVAEAIWRPLALEAFTKDVDGLDLDQAEPINRRLRCYFEAGFASSSIKNLDRIGQSWEFFARTRGFDPTDPPAEQLASYIALLAESKAICTVRNALSGIRYYIRTRGMATTRDGHVTWAPEVLAVVEGAARLKPVPEKIPLFVEDVRLIVSRLGTGLYAISDRLLVLCAFFAGLSPVAMGNLRREHCRVEDGFVFLGPGLHGRKSITIGGLEDPDLDVCRWLTKWLELLEFMDGPTGPLFPTPAARGSFAATPLTEMAIAKRFRKLARSAGKSGRRVYWALRRGATIQGVEKSGVVVTAQQLGYRSTLAVQVCAPKAALIAQKLRLLMGKGRKPNFLRPRRALGRTGDTEAPSAISSGRQPSLAQ